MAKYSSNDSFTFLFTLIMETTKATNFSIPSDTKFSTEKIMSSAEIAHRVAANSNERKILRQHLFSGRLITLSRIYAGKPLPVFESSQHLFNVSVNFHGRRMILKMSKKDAWTQVYVDKLKKFNFEQAQDYQSLTGMITGAVFGSFGFTSLLRTTVMGFAKSLLAQLTSTVCACAVLIKTSDTFIMTQMMVIILANLGAGFDIMSRIVTPLITAGMVFQSNKPFTWVPTCVGVILAAILGATSVGQLTGVLTRTAAMGYTMSTVLCTTRLLQDCVSNLVPFIYKLTTGREWELDTVASSLEDFSTFVTRVEEFEKIKAMELELNLNYQKEVYELQDLYVKIMREADKLKMRVTAQPLLSAYYQKVAKWLQLVNSSGLLKSGARQEPVCILLSGKPGAGKSYLVNELVREVGGDSIPWRGTEEETIANHIYQRNPAVPHWSGYRQQFATLYDDFMQLADQPGAPNPELMEMIQAAGTNAFHLPMAELEEKSKAFFRSELIICTSNLDRFGPSVVKSIISPAALQRRFNVHANVRRVGNEYFFDMILDGSVRHTLDFPSFVNVCRAQLRKRQAAFKEKVEQSKKQPPKTEHACVARLIAYTSGPSNIEDTAMKRKSYSAEEPDHSFCHEDLPCRQHHQAWWNIFMPSNEPPQTFLRDIPFGVICYDRGFFDLELQTPETQHRLDDLHEQLIDSDLFAMNELNIIRTHGARVGAMVRRIYEEQPELAAVRVTIRVNDTETARTRLDLARDAALEEEFLDPRSSIEAWADLLWSAVQQGLRAVGGLFRGIYEELMNRRFIVGAITSTLLVMIASRLFVELFVYASKTFWPTRVSVDDEMVVRFRDRIRSCYEPESRDALGQAKSHKTATKRLKYENYGDRELTDYLEIITIPGSTFEFVAVRSDIWADYLADPKNLWKKDRAREAFKLYSIFATECHTDPVDQATGVQQMVPVFKMFCRNGVTCEDLLKLLGCRESELEIFDELPKEYREPMYESLFKKYEPQHYQGSADQNADGITRKILRNLCEIRTTNSVCDVSKIFFYSGRKAWINKHALRDLGFPNGSVTITRHLGNGQKQYLDVQMKDIKCIEHPDLDIALLQFPKSFSPQLDMLEHIMRDSDLNFEVVSAGRVVTRREGEAMILNASLPRKNTEALITPDMQEFDVATAMTYSNMHTIRGDCGSPFLVIDPTKQRKICGFHMMGNSRGAGTSVIITQDMIVELEEAGKFDTELVVKVSGDLSQEFQACDFVYDPIKLVEAPFDPTKTKIRPSVIHGVVSEPTTKPAIIKKYDDFDPMERGVKEFQRDRPIIPEDFQREVQGVLTRYTSGPVAVARTLTWSEAATGVGLQGMEPIDLGTSPGWPLCTEMRGQGKRPWFTEEHEPTEELIKLCEQMEDEILNGVLTDPPVFRDTLKDERVKLAKANWDDRAKIKTRLFSASPLVFLMLLRKYYGAFFSHLIMNNVTNTTTSGVNPFGPDWQRIANWLHQASPNVDDGDYSCFDTTQPAGFLKPVYDSIRHWYLLNGGSVSHDIIRERLAELCFHSFHLARGTIYRVEGSLPSGMFGTTAINSGVNLVAFYYAFKQIYPEATSSDFLDNVRTVSHGDDVLFSVSTRFKEFTSEAIGKALSGVGMTFTPALKGGVATVARPIEEVSFLKRGFKILNGIYRAPLTTESSLEMCNWITKTNDQVSATIENVETAFRELAISEDDDSYQKLLQEAVYKETNVLLHIPTQNEVLASFREHF